jgi:hypothetical protein
VRACASAAFASDAFGRRENAVSSLTDEADDSQTGLEECTFETMKEWAGGVFDTVNHRYIPPPSTCVFERRVTPELARKCMANRTLAFVGDSNIRDFGYGVVRFLSGDPPMSRAERLTGTDGSSGADGSFPKGQEHRANWSWRVNIQVLLCVVWPLWSFLET